MGERVYSVAIGDGKTIDVCFSEMDDDWGCLCTFPHDDHGKLDAERVRSLALLGAAVVLAAFRREQLETEDGWGGTVFASLPNAVPQWIRDEIRRVVPEERER